MATAVEAPQKLREWADEFRRLSESDPAIQAQGRFYSCSFLLDMEQHRFLVRMHDGKVEDILIDPGPLDERYQFAVRASADTWRKFAQPTPEPMYHGIWAGSFRTDMRLEGDLLVLMQNLRNFTLQLELLRKTGVPV